MPKMTFKGSLKSILDDLAFTMQGLLAKSGGAKIAFDEGVATGVTIFGSFSVPGSGTNFITGQMDRLRFDDVAIDGLIEGRHLLIENMGVRADGLFDLLTRAPGFGSYGSLESNAFSRYLGNRNWTLEGSNSDDIVVSSRRMSLDGTDKIIGKGGSDYLEGGSGGDQIFGGGGFDTLKGQGGADVLKSGAGKDALDGGAGKDRLFGGAQNDRLLGAGDSDRLFGGTGQDILRGGDGNDTLDGGRGWDNYYGGRGADSFVFRGSHGRDWIRDFQNGKDEIVFDRPGRVTETRVGDDTHLTHADGIVIVVGVLPSALSLEDGVWA